jgi:regulator of ribosome biosynthesis
MDVGGIANKNYDLGALIYHDASSYENTTSEQIFEKTKENINKFYQLLFDHRKKQPARGVLEFETPFYTVDLPRIEEKIPRLVPPPKPKPETKWEKFRKERGLAPRKRRDRKVLDPVTGRFVRRFGHKSIKKLQEKRTAIIEVKPGEDHIDPFERMAVEKKLMLAKEKQKALQNQMRAAGVNMKILRENKSRFDTVQPEKKSKKRDFKANKKQERDGFKKSLDKTLKNAQISTASMGVYDKKATKNEKSVKRKKKKNVNLSVSDEKERGLKMLKILKKKDEIAHGVVNNDVLVRKRQAETDKVRANARKRTKN